MQIVVAAVNVVSLDDCFCLDMVTCSQNEIGYFPVERGKISTLRYTIIAPHYLLSLFLKLLCYSLLSDWLLQYYFEMHSRYFRWVSRGIIKTYSIINYWEKLGHFQLQTLDAIIFNSFLRIPPSLAPVAIVVLFLVLECLLRLK